MITAHTDGSISHNPGGRIGIGVYITEIKNGCLKEYAKLHREFPKHEDNTVNVAEYLALIECLKWLLENVHQHEEILIKSDSQLLVMHCNYRWSIKEDTGYYPYAVEALNLLKKFNNVKVKWISRDYNSIADSLSKIKK